MASSKSSRLPWFLLLIIIVGMAGFVAWRRSNRAAVGTYLTAPVSKGDLTQAVTATGTLNPVINVTVGSQISGIVQKLSADFNTPVKEGQIIALIDPATYQAAVTEAQGELANAHSALELATVNANRTRRLLATSNAAQSEVDAADAGLHQAQAQVEIKEGALQRAKIDLERCSIYAPIDGIVISRSVDVGQTVAASLSAPILFTIANDLTKMQIDANVAEADVGAVEVGQKVNFTVDAFPYRIFHGTVTQVRNAPLTVQNVVTYDTVIGVDNDDLKLKPGMTANVSVVITERTDAVKLPNAALRVRLDDTPPPARQAGAGPRSASGSPRMGGGRKHEGGARPTQTVYVLAGEKGKPEPHEVKLGITDGVDTEVLSGVNEGDTVVTGILTTRPAAAGGTTNPFNGAQRPGGAR